VSSHENRAVMPDIDCFCLRWVTEGFSDHVANGDFSLFENLNWLNRNLDELLSHPPVAKTKEQAEADKISQAQQKDLKPPVKKDHYHQSQQQLSVSAPVFTPQQQPQQQQQKKKTSLFYEKDDIKRNKVIVVNDPSLIVEQAEEEEVEVQLADGDEVDQLVNNGNEEGSSVLAGVSQPVIRKGTEIRLIEPKLESISLFKCSLLHIMVKCARCKDTVEVENIQPDQDEDATAAASSSSLSKKPHSKKERWMACPTCTSILGIKFLGGKVNKKENMHK
jgi:hypothetical protein